MDVGDRQAGRPTAYCAAAPLGCTAVESHRSAQGVVPQLCSYQVGVVAVLEDYVGNAQIGVARALLIDRNEFVIPARTAGDDAGRNPATHGTDNGQRIGDIHITSCSQALSLAGDGQGNGARRQHDGIRTSVGIGFDHGFAESAVGGGWSNTGDAGTTWRDIIQTVDGIRRVGKRRHGLRMGRTSSHHDQAAPPVNVDARGQHGGRGITGLDRQLTGIVRIIVGGVRR